MADEQKAETPVEEPAAAAAAEATEETPAADGEEELREPAKVARPRRDDILEAEGSVKAEIAAIDKKMSDITKKLKSDSDARDNGNDGAGNARSEMKRLKQAKETLIRERQEIYSARESAKANLDAKMNERRDLKSQTKFKSVEEIERRISELDQLQHTTSMPLKEEKKILKEIDELKKSKKLVAQFSAVGSSIDDQRRSAEDYQSQIAEKNAQLDAIKKQMDEHGSVLKKLDDKKKDSPAQGLKKERDALREQKKEKQTEIQALWDGFKAANNKWKKNQDEWKVYKAKRDKAYEAERDRRRAEQKAAREAELASKTPYEEEMDLCDYLVNYLTTSFMGEKKAEVVEEKAADYSGFEGAAMVSKKGAEDDYLSLGGGKKKKGKGKKGPKGAKGGKIILAIDTIETFSLLKIQPPATVDAVPALVEALKAKKEYFSTLPRGEIESIAEINQKYEDKMDRRGGDRDRAPRDSKPKGGKKAKAAEFSLTDEFPSLPGAPKPVKAAEEEKGDEAAAEEEA
eukprot:CAMPEP_0119482844 /NCGR_PEP_ID=MMETSP1344-20130328/10525_1 /TAXON_ID=236787 /ORGANISM="Florenciella parvula, Strain CCMP2471" /LENGTH=515 /DNA_ID=CAMNT_0007517297 /DNA_START=18 /DNA_END=1565 /DNA_ORIENTATION=-